MYDFENKWKVSYIKELDDQLNELIKRLNGKSKEEIFFELNNEKILEAFNRTVNAGSGFMTEPKIVKAFINNESKNIIFFEVGIIHTENDNPHLTTMIPVSVYNLKYSINEVIQIYSEIMKSVIDIEIALQRYSETWRNDEREPTIKKIQKEIDKINNLLK